MDGCNSPIAGWDGSDQGRCLKWLIMLSWLLIDLLNQAELNIPGDMTL